MNEFDLIDKKIMLEMDIDARQSYNQLAKKVRISPELARYRLKKLIDDKVILGFNIVIDIGKIGFFHYEVYLRFQKINEEKEKEIINYLKTANNILWLASCLGHYDIVFSVIAKDNIQFSKVLSDILDKYGEFIFERNVQSTIKIPHFSRNYLVPNSKVHEFSFSSSRNMNVSMDRIDFTILRILMNDARMHLTKLSKKTGISLDIVNYRLKQLIKKGVIQLFRAHIDKRKLNRMHFQILFNFKNLNSELKSKFIEFCRQLDSSTYVLDTIGKYDLILELEPENQKEFNNILKKIRYEFSDQLIDYEPLTITEDIKYDYFRLDEKEFFR
ncbi:Lrp/AsnC family transcriptional regulator [Candidatus Woesearchaeota archaeon]|nr:Lrp/AsnC family transcriptional regulator [Candidatus Woesearchaeota archaeon]